VHFAYDRTRRFAQTAVTIMDQAGTSAPLDFVDVLRQATLFLMSYMSECDQWPAELRTPGAGRTRNTE
jgi:hypothetical protein